MDEALLGSAGIVITADRFSQLPSGEQASYRENLLCPACRADAYFIREARNGRRACFGARPHNEDCELASISTEYGGNASLDETDEQINAGDEFRLEPIRNRAIRHVEHDPSSPPGTGSAARYTRAGGGRVRTSSIGLERLLRQLATRPGFTTAPTLLVLPYGTRGRVRTVCRHISEVDQDDANRRRIYWGTIRFPQLSEDGGAWLNTGTRRAPTVRVGADELESLLELHGLDDVEELSGSFFAYWGHLRQGPSGKLLVFADDVQWFAIRRHAEDEELS